MAKKNIYVISTENMLPKSNLLSDCIKAFIIGGLICCIGQGFHDLYAILFKFSEDVVKMLVPSTLVFLGGLFTGIGIYDDLGKFAGAGSVVPITGFANSVVSCAIEFKQEGSVLGIGANMFKIAGPVIVFGTLASSVYGLIYWIFSVLLQINI